MPHLTGSGEYDSLDFITFVKMIGLKLSMSAKAGDAHVMKATIRVVLGGAIAVVVTYGVGRLFGANGI